jgi:DNA-directed RNA polymerase
MHVNLTPYEEGQKPGDIYSVIGESINQALNEYGKENPEFSVLSLVRFTRSILKQCIMTKVYNVRNYGIAKQITSKLKSIKITEINDSSVTDEVISKIKEKLKKSNDLYIAPGINGNVYLTDKDIFKIAKIVNDQIFVLFPSLNEIYNYFISMANLMLLLNIPLSWFTPTGLNITQQYLKSKQTKIAIKIAGKGKKLILRE